MPTDTAKPQPHPQPASTLSITPKTAWWPELMDANQWAVEGREVCEGFDHQDAPEMVGGDRSMPPLALHNHPLLIAILRGLWHAPTTLTRSHPARPPQNSSARKTQTHRQRRRTRRRWRKPPGSCASPRLTTSRGSSRRRPPKRGKARDRRRRCSGRGRRRRRDGPAALFVLVCCCRSCHLLPSFST